MRKIIEAGSDNDIKRDKNLKALTGLAALSIVSNSSKNKNRRKLMNDIMYYLRKLISLAKQVQSLSEGVEDDRKLEDEILEFEKIKSEIDELVKEES